MAKVEVILVENVIGLGAESDQVKVASGYARNFLLPNRLAIPVTSANKRRLEVLRQRRAEREAHEFNAMTELAKSLSKLTAVLSVKTGDDGKMFGSVTAGTIADQLKNQFDIALDKKKIHLAEPIRSLGDHEVELKLHAEVKTTLKVKVQSLTPPPAATTEDAAGKDKQGEAGGDRRTEKRGRKPAEGKKPEAKA
ncbi:MAG: 50S ribosomal protein L9 [Verrucomicrobiales bacterium]|jgi:large subunit ribosomal protein L9|nr:50S ribosomal protein L9 [Verrucomicrobiales bacterium]